MNIQNNTPHSEFQNSASTPAKLKLSELRIFVFSEFPCHYASTLREKKFLIWNHDFRKLSEIKIHGKKTDQENSNGEAPKSNNSQNGLTLKVSDLEDPPMCRICYNGPSRERLLKPCKCKGSIKYVHRHCLERWLESTSNDACELCQHHFTTKRTRKSLWEWCRQPETRRDRCNFYGDCACFLFLTPLGLATFWLCTEGAVYYQKIRGSTLETVALVTLAFFLVMAYVTWIALCARYHIIVWSRWFNHNYHVRIVDRQSDTSSTRQSSSSDSETETASLTDLPTTRQKLPLVTQPLPVPPRPPTPHPYAVRRLQMDGQLRTVHPYSIRRQDLLGSSTLHQFAARRPRRDVPPSDLEAFWRCSSGSNGSMTANPSMDESPILTFNPNAAGQGPSMNELKYSSTLNTNDIRFSFYNGRSLAVNPKVAVRSPSMDEFKNMLTCNLNAADLGPSLNEPHASLTLEPYHNRFSTDDGPRMTPCSSSHQRDDPSMSVTVNPPGIERPSTNYTAV